MIGIIREVIALRKQRKSDATLAELEAYFNTHFKERFENKFEEVFEMRLAQHLMNMPEQDLRFFIKTHRPGFHLTETGKRKSKEAHPQETGVSEGGDVA
jgi:hypothetical protein